MAWNETTQGQYKRSNQRFETNSTNEEWDLVGPMFPPASKMGRPRTTDLRAVFDAIQSILGTGCQWRAIPKCFPPFTTVQNYFYTWRDDGTLVRIMEALRMRAREVAGRSRVSTAAAIDSQSVKTTESGGPSGYDAGKKIKGRKRHICVDVEGLPIESVVHVASIQDRDGALPVILGMLEKAPDVSKLWADGGYQGPKFRSQLERQGLGSILEIINRPKDIKGFTVLKRRWVVERTFAWMGRCRRLAKDYERSLASSLAWAQLAACRFMMRRIARAVTQ